jgi:Xaa-Pro aminopeptidase
VQLQDALTAAAEQRAELQTELQRVLAARQDMDSLKGMLQQLQAAAAAKAAAETAAAAAAAAAAEADWRGCSESSVATAFAGADAVQGSIGDVTTAAVGQQQHAGLLHYRSSQHSAAPRWYRHQRVAA